MVEAGAQGASEAEVLDAIDFGHQCCKKVIAGIRELMAQAGKTKMVFTPHQLNQELYGKIAAEHRATLSDVLDTEKYPKLESYAKTAALKKTIIAAQAEENQPEAAKIFDALKERIFRDDILDKHRRPDGRKFDQIRPISIEVDVLPRVHGSACSTAARRRPSSPSRSAPPATSSGSMLDE